MPFGKFFGKNKTPEKVEGGGSKILNFNQEQEKNNKITNQLLGQSFLKKDDLKIFPTDEKTLIEYAKSIKSHNDERRTIIESYNYGRIDDTYENIALKTDNNGEIESVHGNIVVAGNNFGNIESTHGDIYLKGHNNNVIKGVHSEIIILGDNNGNIKNKHGNVIILGNNNLSIESEGNIIILGNNKGSIKTLGKIYIQGNNKGNIATNSEIFIFGNNSGIIDGGKKSILVWRNNEKDGIIGGNQYKIIIGGSNFGQVGNAYGSIEIYGENKGRTTPNNSALKNRILDKEKILTYIINDIQGKEEVWSLRGLDYPYNDNTYTKVNTIGETINTSRERTSKLKIIK